MTTYIDIDDVIDRYTKVMDEIKLCRNTNQTILVDTQYGIVQTMPTFDTFALHVAKHSFIPPSELQHDPRITNNDGMTVAMYLAQNKIIPPPQWEHDPCIYNIIGQTVALLLARNGIVPPLEWQHDPGMKYTYDDKTVNDYLKEKNIEVPERWKRLIDYVMDRQLEGDKQQCMICLDDEFTWRCRTRCGHVVCEECSRKWFTWQCPYCKCADFRVHWCERYL